MTHAQLDQLIQNQLAAMLRTATLAAQLEVNLAEQAGRLKAHLVARKEAAAR